MKVLNSLIGIGVAAALGVPALAQEDLKAKVLELEQQLNILKRQLEIDKEAAAEKSKTAPVFSAGASGFTFRSADTNFVLKVRGYVQADGRFFVNDDNPSAPNDTFLVRRVRPILEGTVYDKFDYRVMLDFGSGVSGASLTGANNAFVQDAYMTARFAPWFQVQAGKMKEPINLERFQSSVNLLFVERGYPSSLTPNRDVGVQIQGETLNGALAYVAGVFNGVGNGSNGDIEAADDEKDVAGRIFATPFKEADNSWLRGFGIGVGGSFGNQEGAVGALRSPGQQAIFSYTPPAATPANTVTADGDHWRIAPQGYYYKGPFGIFGEYVISNQDLRRSSAAATTFLTARNSAWVLAGSYFLTGEDNSFKAVAPRKPFKPSEGAWGAFELTARVQQLDIDDDIFAAGFANPATSVTEATSWGAGINWHLNRNFKVNLNYEETDFKGGTSAFLRDGERAVLSRAQVSF